MKQFGKILKFELKYFFRNKIFVGITIFLVFIQTFKEIVAFTDGKSLDEIEKAREEGKR